MTNRREFLRVGAVSAGIVFGCGGWRSLAPGRAGHGHGVTPTSAQQRAFRGAKAGDEREVEGIRVCWCPPGRFTMGSPAAEPGHRPDEIQVEVELTRGFWTGKSEVTQAQWRRIVGDFPAQPPSARFGEGGAFPLYWVNFHEAEEFCARLTRVAHRSGSLPAGWEFRLPTEAQWEYACRAGTMTATSFGAVLGTDQANFGDGPLERGGPARGSARRVGSYPANPWGIHDMHGNVWEWCRDYYHARLPGGTDPDLRDVMGAPNRDGTHSRVRRGGAWIEEGWACRSACRLRYEPPRRSDHIGFRVVAVER